MERRSQGFTDPRLTWRPNVLANIRRLGESPVHYDPHPFLSKGMEVEVVRAPLAGGQLSKGRPSA